ncbi:hypothetical protein VHA01S_005_00600 [Vibrio halioticoli NBRC 102217]|uniref:DUF1513 domain-containing protein n=1 Tax=Vibrio halioticoli NBRC 102217 TaxID=1219072 RepID=V5FHI0_9VIBR|nr:DUF1513 domain-containing protein [Vibrio halioticoli]GAD88457.1 hypothetical protein VHA01S_005_00600 [Vibrio halioticoli NBRC 102217]
MAINDSRRTLLKGLLCAGVTPYFASGCSSAGSSTAGNATASKPTFIGCATNHRNHFMAVIADQYGQPIHQFPLAERGHGSAVSTVRQHVTVFARRPGQYFQVYNYLTGKSIQLKLASRNRYFYGHGVYSSDSRWLYTTEGEVGSSRGIIGVYDTEHAYQKVAEFNGFGIGPHEIIRLDHDVLAMAVGGIQTDGREPINLANMQPSLCYLSSQGELMDQVYLADQQLSIRHLSKGKNALYCALQNKGDLSEHPALIYGHSLRKGNAQKSAVKLTPLQAEPEQWARFHNYIGSISTTEQWVIATSPIGNCYGIWSQQSGQLLELSSLPDASGVTANHNSFAISSGSGSVILERANDGERQRNQSVTPLFWDNHWSRI